MKEAWQESISDVVTTLRSRISKLVLTDRPLHVYERVPPATEQKVDDEVREDIDKSYDKSRAVERKLREMPQLNALLRDSAHWPLPCKYCFRVMTVGGGKHCQNSHCACAGCGVASKLPRVTADNLQEVPLPMVKEGVYGYLSRYADTTELYGTKTSTGDLPSCCAKVTDKAMKLLPE